MTVYEFWICFILSVMLFELHRGITLVDTFLNYEDEDEYDEEALESQLEEEWDEEDQVLNPWKENGNEGYDIKP